MKDNTIAARLFKIKWSGENLSDYSVIVVDRLSERGIKEVRLGEDVTILKDRLIVGEKTIPLHRVVAIKRGGEVIWSRNAYRGS